MEYGTVRAERGCRLARLTRPFAAFRTAVRPISQARLGRFALPSARKKRQESAEPPILQQVKPNAHISVIYSHAPDWLQIRKI